MNIQILAKLTVIGLVYIYTARLIDTIYHGIFRPSIVAGTIVGLNILAGMIQLLFFIVLYRQFVPCELSFSGCAESRILECFIRR